MSPGTVTHETFLFSSPLCLQLVQPDPDSYPSHDRLRGNTWLRLSGVWIINT